MGAAGRIHRRAPLAIRDVVRDRFEVIGRFVASGTVLDVGCVDSRSDREETAARMERKPALLFRQIVAINPKTIGVDIDGVGVARLREQGYSVEPADAETMELERRFDTIVAGEIIEHLENPGRALRNWRRHLHDSGVLILTTPNPFSARRTWKIWRYGSPIVHEDHTCWFDPITLTELLHRTGFEVSEGYWIQPRSKAWQSWPHRIRRYFCHHFILVARAGRAAYELR